VSLRIVFLVFVGAFFTSGGRLLILVESGGINRVLGGVVVGFVNIILEPFSFR